MGSLSSRSQRHVHAPVDQNDEVRADGVGEAPHLLGPVEPILSFEAAVAELNPVNAGPKDLGQRFGTETLNAWVV